MGNIFNKMYLKKEKPIYRGKYRNELILELTEVKDIHVFKTLKKRKQFTDKQAILYYIEKLKKKTNQKQNANS